MCNNFLKIGCEIYANPIHDFVKRTSFFLCDSAKHEATDAYDKSWQVLSVNQLSNALCDHPLGFLRASLSSALPSGPFRKATSISFNIVKQAPGSSIFHSALLTERTPPPC